MDRSIVEGDSEEAGRCQVITICLDDHQINGVSVKTIEIWRCEKEDQKAGDNRGELIVVIPVDNDEEVTVRDRLIKLTAGEDGEAVVVLQ